MRIVILLMLVALAGTATRSQTCPANHGTGSVKAAKPSELHGTMRYHDDLREWLGIEFTRPICGQKEVEIIFSRNVDWRKAKAVRGCTVTVTGTLYDSPTGYYSADMAMEDPTLKVDPSCRQFPIEPDLSAVEIAPNVNSFGASITVDYRGKGRVDVRVWADDEKRVMLTPWEAYVHYLLTGGRDLVWFGCHAGFQINDISQIPVNLNGIFNDPSNGTGAELQKLDGANVIEFRCERKKKDDDVKKQSGRQK